MHSFAGDSWQECKEYVREKLYGVKSTGRTCNHLAKRQVSNVDKRGAAMDIWNRSEALQNTPAERYLSNRLSKQLLPDCLHVSNALRFSAEQKLAGAIGALVALMRDPITTTPTGVHLTYLNQHAGNLRLGGRNLRGFRGYAGVVCFGSSDEMPEELGIAEGLETALAASVLNLGLKVWPTLSTAGLAKFPPLNGVKRLTIFADNDRNGAGLDAARRAARAWHQVGALVEVKMPAERGMDWNDVLGKHHA